MSGSTIDHKNEVHHTPPLFFILHHFFPASQPFLKRDRSLPSFLPSDSSFCFSIANFSCVPFYIRSFLQFLFSVFFFAHFCSLAHHHSSPLYLHFVPYSIHTRHFFLQPCPSQFPFNITCRISSIAPPTIDNTTSTNKSQKKKT